MITENETDDLFDASGKIDGTDIKNISYPEKRTPSTKWYLITNHRNLLRLLSTGIFIHPGESNSGYLDDFFSDYPAHVLLFADKVPQTAFERILSARKGIVPVVIQYDISVLSGACVAINEQFNQEEIMLPNDLDGRHRSLLIPAPLPTASIQTIYFETKDKKENFIDKASVRRNVPFKHWPIKVSKLLFKTNKINMDFHLNSQVIDNKMLTEYMERAQIVGGIQTLHFHLANTDRQANLFYQWAYQTEGRSDRSHNESIDEILRVLPHWIETGEVDLEVVEDHSKHRVFVDLFWRIIERMVSPSDGDLTAYDLVLHVLRDGVEYLDGGVAANINRLIEELESLRDGLPTNSVDDLLNSFKTPFPRALILFFVRDNCRDFLENEFSCLTITDRLVASILFATRELWLTLALDIRGSERFSKLISFSIAKQFHQLSKSGVSVVSSVPKIEPLYELLLGENAVRSSAMRYRDARVLCAKRMDWDCIQTTLSLPNGDYSLQGSSSAIKIVLTGEIKSITTDVDLESFIGFFSSTNRIDHNLEDEIRKVVE